MPQGWPPEHPRIGQTGKSLSLLLPENCRVWSHRAGCRFQHHITWVTIMMSRSCSQNCWLWCHDTHVRATSAKRIPAHHCLSLQLIQFWIQFHVCIWLVELKSYPESEPQWHLRNDAFSSPTRVLWKGILERPGIEIEWCRLSYLQQICSFAIQKG